MGFLALTLYRDEYRDSFLLQVHHLIELNKVSRSLKLDTAVEFGWLEGNERLELVSFEDNTQDFKPLFSQFKDVL